MLIETKKLLARAASGGYAVGAFNVYNLEGALAVIEAAEALESPVMLQVLPSALDIGGSTLVAACLEAARKAVVPASVHLDHCSDPAMIQSALDAGVSSVMADGSMHDFETNLLFTKKISDMAQKIGAGVEAELGRIAGTEDKMTLDVRDACLTKVSEAQSFVRQVDIAALAVCIGNVHGKYTRPPALDFERLEQIRKKVSVPLVLHGTSGLPDEMIRQAVSLGVCKFNVNTEIRTAYLSALFDCFKAGENSSKSLPELVDIMTRGIAAMKTQVCEKLHLFGSAGKAG